MKSARQLREERMCHRCGHRYPPQRMDKKRTPAGGAIYTCQRCKKGAKERKSACR